MPARPGAATLAAKPFRTMELRVVAPGVRPLIVLAERSDTVLELKRRVHAQLGRLAQRTPPAVLRLRVAQPPPPPGGGGGASGAGARGGWFNERRTLGASGVRPGATLELVVPARLAVHPLGAGTPVELWADRFAPLAELRAQLGRRARAGGADATAAAALASGRLPLAHAGRVLADDRPLAAYRLGHGAALSAVARAPASSRFCAARAALAELAHTALAGVDEAVSRPTPPLPPGATAGAHANASVRLGAVAAAEQARALAGADAALRAAIDALAPLRRTDAALRAELRELADADAAAAAELRRAAARARALLGAARAGLRALETDGAAQ
ncbi:hypothetical protein KFE25_012337 [Diacronema lutheri]|uniref:Ubiquitin-like domain-containing protein n=1 Tax=Diacronema lutheri TaxID=2081491 RepID=A0A8J5XQW0_DIALT|nr:hypothetical protein KFE25_012337 [Diacronema lutheri]